MSRPVIHESIQGDERRLIEIRYDAMEADDRDDRDALDQAIRDLFGIKDSLSAEDVAGFLGMQFQTRKVSGRLRHLEAEGYVRGLHSGLLNKTYYEKVTYE